MLLGLQQAAKSSTMFVDNEVSLVVFDEPFVFETMKAAVGGVRQLLSFGIGVQSISGSSLRGRDEATCGLNCTRCSACDRGVTHD